MGKYVAQRMMQALVVVVCVSLLVFAMLHLLPGSPARAMLGPRATAAEIATFNHENGYDRSIVTQYVLWVKHLVHGDLGYSYQRNQPVSTLIGQYLPKTMLLVGVATLLAILIAVPLGVWQAAKRNSATDHALTGISFVFYSMPDFWLGQLLILVFAATLGLLPAEAPQGGVGSVVHDPLAFILPVATLTLVTVALFSRYMRSSMVDNLAQDYVRTAHAGGIPPRRVLFGYVLRNALLPIATLVGLSLPWLVSGAVITEAVFNYPGAGLLFWNAAQTRDFPVLLGLTLVVGVLTVIGSMLADLLYAILDPRVRYVRS